MEKPKDCPCGPNLGVEQLSTQDVKDSQHLINHAIDFQGRCGISERTMIKTKIEELKQRIGEYYFDKDNKLIAIPNQIALPKNPHIIDPEETSSSIKILSLFLILLLVTSGSIICGIFGRAI